MTFSPEWGRHWTNAMVIDRNYSSMLSYQVMMACGADLKDQRMLELGCGQGANIRWVKQAGGDYWGIDGSMWVVDIVCEEYPELAEQMAVADFTEVQPFPGEFDIIFDRASVCHNNRASIQKAIDLAYASLKPGGLYFGSDWFSINHSEFARGEVDGDANTRTDYKDGQFRDIGKVHFVSESDIREIFHKFDGTFLQERVTRRVAPGFVKTIRNPVWQSSDFNEVDYRASVFDLVARKPR